MNRQALLLGLAFVSLAGAGHAQPRAQSSRDDLLDALTRHIQICTEIADGQERLACFDRLQTRVGSVQPATPQPTPLARDVQAGGALTPQPLGVPGGGVATLGGQQPIGRDPDTAFDPRESGYRPPATPMAKPQPALRRTGPRPLQPARSPQPLVSLDAQNLTYNDSRYWQVTIVVTSNTPRALDVQIQCTFTNAGKSAGEAYFGPTPIQAGEQLTTALIGPPTTVFVDSTTCRVLSP